MENCELLQKSGPVISVVGKTFVCHGIGPGFESRDDRFGDELPIHP